MENDEHIVFAPVGWTPSVDKMILIPVDADIRFDSGPAPNKPVGPLRCSDR